MNKFTITENLFTQEILDNIISKYAKWNSTDKPSDYWPEGAKNKDAIVSVEPLTDQDQMLLKEYLFTEDISLFKGFKPIKNATFMVFKAKPGYILSAHEDYCIASLTVFIDPDATWESGGEFYWVDKAGNKNIVNNHYNTGILWKSQDNEATFNPKHGTLINNKDRFVMQMFVKEKPNRFDIKSEFKDIAEQELLLGRRW